MPSMTRPPGPLAPPAEDTPPAAPAPGDPPGQAALSGRADAAADPSWDGLRLVRVPGGWPPYDCEAHGATCPAVTPVPPAGGWDGTAPADAAPARTSAEPGGTTSGTVPVGATAPGGTDAPGLAAAWTGQFARVLVEILAGLRPARQLAPWTTERVRAQVDQLSRAVDAEQRPRIRRIMTSRPAAEVVEMTTVIGFGSRSRALAMRFEHVPARPPAPGRPARPARWLCTEIETGLPDPTS